MIGNLIRNARALLDLPAVRLALGTSGVLFGAKLLQDLGGQLAGERFALMQEVRELRAQRNELAEEIRARIGETMHRTAATMAARIAKTDPPAEPVDQVDDVDDENGDDELGQVIARLTADV